MLLEQNAAPPLEQHYTVRQIANSWGVSEDTVYRAFRNVPGVLRLGNNRQGMRIPESVFQKVYKQRTQ